VVAWLASILLTAGGAVAGWFVAEDAPNYHVYCGVAAMILLSFTVAGLAFWPARWRAFPTRTGSSSAR
jgi:hypothetical protein